MNRPLRYYSTNRRVPPVSLAEALLQGQAADRGLFMPDHLPQLDWSRLSEFQQASYPEVAEYVLQHFTAELATPEQLRSWCREAYSFQVPLERVTQRHYLLRLDRGPTASFKDFAARMMARWMSHLMQQQAEELIILTATSGDTGSAVAHAFHRVPRIRVVVLFPQAEVSDRQRRQMTTLGDNITTWAVAGKFDDCQALVKEAFADPDFRKYHLSSANSINIGRLLPQSVYYVYAYLQLAEVAQREPITFSIPSGNFGDMMGAMLAWKMGLPINKLIIATNVNDEFPRFLQSGQYQKIVPSHVGLSNAMNVGHPSNLARLIDLYGGWLDETGLMREPADMVAMRRDLFATPVSDERTRHTIRETYQRHQVLLEPHGAVGWAGVMDYVHQHPDAEHQLVVSLETAHPAKFPEEIRQILQIDPPLPPSLSGLDERTEQYSTLPADYATFKRQLRQHLA